MDIKKDSIIKSKGYILRQTVLGKDQKSVSYYDYFFLSADSGAAKIFIKVKEGDVPAEEIDKLLKKENDLLWKSEEVEIVAHPGEGKWDEPDLKSNINLTLDPKRQGRYLVLKEINPLKKQSSAEYTGRFIRLQQVNKAGKKLKTFDYFFEIDGKEYFVKNGDKTVKRDEIESLTKRDSSGAYKSELLKIKGEIKKGLWDTDDPRQQSRIGEYIFIYRIIIE